MNDKNRPVAIFSDQAELRRKSSNYPEPFASRMSGREKRPLGDIFGLNNFGVNLTRLSPQAVSALRHAHSRQDEFIYVLAGRPTLITDEGDTELAPGMCAGFQASSGNGHMIVNRTTEEAVYLEVGDRSIGDAVDYPDDDLKAITDTSGNRGFTHKDGLPY